MKWMEDLSVVISTDRLICTLAKKLIPSDHMPGKAPEVYTMRFVLSTIGL